MTMTYTRTVSVGDDIIDPRDIVERVAELENVSREHDEETGDDSDDLSGLDDDEIRELSTWRKLLDDISDPEDGEALILDSYFEEYAQQLAEDIGAIDPNASWPLTCIDWEQAANELQSDYSAVEIGGYTYWTRN